jgi:photosystem II stability/assembly factor-like uncharacterized protein
MNRTNITTLIMQQSTFPILFLLFCSLFFFLRCTTESTPTEKKSEIHLDSLVIRTIDTIAVKSSVRALTVVNDQTIWFAGSGGVFGYTEDGGQNWTIDSILADSAAPHFRSIAVTGKAVHLLAIGSPALLYRSTDKGQNWDVVYREDHPAAFYDAMKFWDDQYGIAMGDPTNGCLSVIRTEDGGQTWEKVSCKQIPPAAEGEAAYAASNSNIALAGEQAWMVSGGTRARVYHSADKGRNWQVFDSPIVEGGQMTGIYSVDFYNEREGIIFGGDWNERNKNTQNKAMTKDGGQSWQLIADGQEPGYRSQVRYLPGTQGQGLIACGIPGISYSLDGGQSWEKISEDSYYAVGVGSTPKVIWLAGSSKIARLDLGY